MSAIKRVRNELGKLREYLGQPKNWFAPICAFAMIGLGAAIAPNLSWWTVAMFIGSILLFNKSMEMLETNRRKPVLSRKEKALGGAGIALCSFLWGAMWGSILHFFAWHWVWVLVIAVFGLPIIAVALLFFLLILPWAIMGD